MKERIVQHERKWLNGFLIFCLGSLIGWLWEAVVYWIGQTPHPPIMQMIGEFRGVLHGPWVPIPSMVSIFDKCFAHISLQRARWICFMVASLFIVDCVYSLITPNMGIGVDLIGRVCT